VVKAELVKKAIQFDGTTAAMERSLDDLIKRMQVLNGEIADQGLGFKPKAIYVCRRTSRMTATRMMRANPFSIAKPHQFAFGVTWSKRKASLPKDIAIYANLTFVEGNKPDEVNLFSKGENDFDDFRAGDYQHIIFNLSLQEGWDDPACYLAYIDKSMGSSIQVEQIIGGCCANTGRPTTKTLAEQRTLLSSSGQPERLRRIDSESESKVAVRRCPHRDYRSFGGAGGGADDLQPKDDVSVKLHHIFVDSEAARKRITESSTSFPLLPRAISTPWQQLKRRHNWSTSKSSEKMGLSNGRPTGTQPSASSLAH